MEDAVKAIQQKIFSQKDEGYKAFQCKLMPNIPPEKVVGVRNPNMRAIAKEISGTPEAEAFLDVLPHEYYEENNLHGMLIEKIKDFDRAAAELDRFLPYVDNWATCDIIRPAAFKKHLPETYEKIREWISSRSTYTVRFGIEMLMTFYLGEEFKPEYSALVASVRSEEYYVNMMSAWYFATALAKNYEENLPFIENQSLDKWTHNKAIQKAIESYRITEEQKTYLRSLKIK
jgi:3-methyladenine DNA glycosylase AlkD